MQTFHAKVFGTQDALAAAQGFAIRVADVALEDGNAIRVKQISPLLTSELPVEVVDDPSEHFDPVDPGSRPRLGAHSWSVAVHDSIKAPQFSRLHLERNVKRDERGPHCGS